MITGNTPPSHAYRMAKLEAEREKAGRPAEPLRSSPQLIMRHWFEDACEDVDNWRRDRRLDKKDRKAAKEGRKEERRRFTEKMNDRWERRRAERDGETPEATDVPKLETTEGPRYAGADETPTPQPEPRPDETRPTPEPETSRPDETRPEPEATTTVVDPTVTVADPHEAAPEGAPFPTENVSAADEPLAEVLPLFPEAVSQGDEVTTPTGTTTGAQATGDQGGLLPHIRWTQAMTRSNTQAIVDVERVVNQMTQGEVGPQTRALVASIQDMHSALAAQYEKLAGILQTHVSVLDAYVGTGSEAGGKQHLHTGR